MSSRGGRVERREFLAGLALLATVAAAVVTLCHWLLLPAEPVPELPALPERPAAHDRDLATAPPPICPAPRRPPGREPTPVSSAELLDCPDSWDGRAVSYRGEVVGAVLRRGDRAWVQLNDDPYGLTVGPLPAHRNPVGANSGLAVSVPTMVAARISHVGGHTRQGDRLAVVGEFRRADPDDGGGPTLHAAHVELVGEGRRLEHALSLRRTATAALLAVATLAAGLALLRARRL